MEYPWDIHGVSAFLISRFSRSDEYKKRICVKSVYTVFGKSVILARVSRDTSQKNEKAILNIRFSISYRVKN